MIIANALIIVVFALIIAISMPKILEPYQAYKDFFTKVNDIGAVSHIDKDEYEAALWLRNNTNIVSSPNANVMSDYATSYLIRGITGMNTSVSRHPLMSQYEWIELQNGIRNILLDPLSSKSSDVMEDIMSQTGSDKMYLSLTKRTCWWLGQDSVHEIRYLPLPKAYPFETYCSYYDTRLRNSGLFQLLFHNGNVSIYEYNTTSN